MIVAVKEIHGYNVYNMPFVAGYTLMDEETGQTKDVSVDDIVNTMKNKGIKIRNLELSPNGTKVRFKGVQYGDSAKYGLMDEDKAWMYIHSLDRDNIHKAEISLRHLMQFVLPLDESVKLYNTISELHGRIYKRNQANKIATFMDREFGRVSDDQLTDFIYTLIWAGKDIYYIALNTQSYGEMRTRLIEYAEGLGVDPETFFDWLDGNDGETWGYATRCVINW